MLNCDRGPGRLQIRADDPSLTAHAGLAIVGEMTRKLRLAEILDGELTVVTRARPVKQRRRGLSPGELVLSLAECQLAGAEYFDDIEEIRADRALAAWRAVCDTPSAPTARQLAQRYRPSHIRAIERAQARAGQLLDRHLGRDVSAPVTIDLDGTESVVYGPRKRGTGRSRTGHLAYHSYVATWAQRGRALTSDLKGGNQAKISAAQSARILGRASRLLPAGHGQVTVRGDSGFYSAELMMALRRRGERFSFSVPRTSTMWATLARIDEQAWQDAQQMRGAQVAEVPFIADGCKHEPLRLIVRRVPVTAADLQAGSAKARRRRTIPPEQLQMVLDGHLDSTFAYSFIVTDIPTGEMSTVGVEYFHRQRAQIEERFKDAKLGQPLRHLPSGNLNANHLWLACSLMALNLCAWVCDVSPAAAASETAPQDTPLRRHAKTLRRLLFCVPARIVRTARQNILRLPDGFPHYDIFNATYHAALALPGP